MQNTLHWPPPYPAVFQFKNLCTIVFLVWLHHTLGTFALGLSKVAKRPIRITTVRINNYRLTVQLCRAPVLPPLAAVAYLGGGHGAMFTPFRATINFFEHVLVYFAKIVLMDLLQANQVQRKVRYFINYSHRDIDLDQESDIDEFGPKNSWENFQKFWLIQESYQVYIFNVFNILCFYRTHSELYNDVVAKKLKLVHLNYTYFTILQGCSPKKKTLHEECKTKSLLEFLRFCVFF